MDTACLNENWKWDWLNLICKDNYDRLIMIGRERVNRALIGCDSQWNTTSWRALPSCEWECWVRVSFFFRFFQCKTGTNWQSEGKKNTNTSRPALWFVRFLCGPGDHPLPRAADDSLWVLTLVQGQKGRFELWLAHVLTLAFSDWLTASNDHFRSHYGDYYYWQMQ